MPLEEEVLVMLTNGFYGVMILSILLVGWLLFRSKNFRLLPFLFFLLLFSLAGFNLLEAINVGRNGVPPAMQSEEASWSIGKAGVFWALSMVVFIWGIFRFVRPIQQKEG